MWTAGIGMALGAGTFLQPVMVGAESPAAFRLWTRKRTAHFDVTTAPYNARGDGSTDDAPAIQAALDDAAEVGGGVVYLPAGTYLLNTPRAQTGVRNYILNYHSNISLIGSGKETTILLAGPGMPDETRILSADSADGGSRVSGVLFKNFTVDGAADQQPDAHAMVGISNVWTERISLMGLRVQQVKGTPGAEGVAFDSYYSSNHSYRDCEALQTASMGSGFGATHSSLISYADCRASGSRYWMGFTAFLSENISYQDCHGFQNAGRGFNSEQNSGVQYRNCLAGGDQQGNRGDGIYLFQSQDVQVFDCVSSGNQSGMANVGSQLRVVRGQFVGNGLAGLAFQTDADWLNTSVEEGPVLMPNGLGPIVIAGRRFSA
jgi:hypothetical protein